MKTRNGFVSNSSSSSFVICLPPDMTADKFCEKYAEDIVQYVLENELYLDDGFETEEDRDKIIAKFKEFMEEFLETGYDYDNRGEGYFFNEDVMHKYVVASINTGPDEGAVVLVDNNKIKKILSES